MLVVVNNTESFNYTVGTPIKDFNIRGDVVVAIDPSKTNMAVFIGNPIGECLTILEFSGNNRRKGPVMDTTEYCREVRSFLREILGNAELYIVGVEAAITKKGMEHHHSSMVLTEIRANILNFFLEEYGIRVIEINNWSWKHHCLPEGYRGQSIKGSKKFFLDQLPDHPLASYFEADATDVYFIFQYIIDTMCNDYRLICNRSESMKDGKSYYIYPTKIAEIIPDTVVLKYNPHFSIAENAAYAANRINRKCLIKVPANTSMKLEEIYGHSMCMFSMEDAEDITIVIG